MKSLNKFRICLICSIILGFHFIYNSTYLASSKYYTNDILSFDASISYKILGTLILIPSIVYICLKIYYYIKESNNEK